MSHEHGRIPVASAKVYRIHGIFGGCHGVLLQEARNNYACLLYLTGCVSWDWPDHEDTTSGSNAAGQSGPVIMRNTS